MAEVLNPSGGYAPLRVDADGKLITATEISGVTIEGGGDASAANQTTQISLETEIRNRLPALLSAGQNLKVSVEETSLTGGATEAKQDSQIALFGGLTETAPASDTASSGLNGRLQRVAQRLSSLIALLPTTLQNGNLRVAVMEGGLTGGATEAKQDSQITLTGAVNEAAPGTDTASSGLNGRLQRIAQNITTLLGRLPASLGAQAVGSSLSVTPATSSAWAVSGTVTANIGTTGDLGARIPVVGEVTITRPAGALTYTAGAALYSAGTAGTAQAVTFNVTSSGATVAAGSTIEITGVQVYAATASPTVLPVADILLSPTTFTALADNAAWVPTAAILRDGTTVTTDYGQLAGASGAISWSERLATQIKLAAGSSALWLQLRWRLAYAATGAEAVKIRFVGYRVA